MNNESLLILLRSSFQALVGTPSPGTVVFVRCLPSEVLYDLVRIMKDKTNGWVVRVVSDRRADGAAVVSADQAVDYREAKRDAMLLLVDRAEAGAGMDGIYSASREITENELLKVAADIAYKSLSKQSRNFCRDAVKLARRLGRKTTVSPWTEFEFLAACQGDTSNIPVTIHILGLWPISVRAGDFESRLALSAQMTEKLLLKVSGNSTVESRVESLLLRDPTETQIETLTNYLRTSDRQHWRVAVRELANLPSLWLGELCPQFASQELSRIRLVPWRSSRGGNPLAWSGLSFDAQGTPVFVVPTDDDSKSKLEVRWKSEPSELPAGAVTYEIQVLTENGTVLASQSVSHCAKSVERCTFRKEDFFDLDETGRWQAVISVHRAEDNAPDATDVHVESDTWRVSEEFVLTFGTTETIPKSSVGKRVRALSEEAIRLEEEDFEEACKCDLTEDRQGYVLFRLKGKSGRVLRPRLIKTVEEDWANTGFGIGRWTLRVREDGTPTSLPFFTPVTSQGLDDSTWKQLETTTRTFAERLVARRGFVGAIYRNNEQAERYVNAWIGAIEAGNPLLALAHTIEVRTQDERTVGLIVLPSHPVRVAWHHAYDELVAHACYQEHLVPSRVSKVISPLDGSYYPTFLPGLQDDRPFVFADMLGFHLVAMVQSGEAEPQACIALMARCASVGGEHLSRLVGSKTGDCIATELSRYSQLHPEYPVLKINAIRPGDGLTMARAMGSVLSDGYRLSDEDDRQIASETAKFTGFDVQLYPSERVAETRLVGRHLSEVAERRRAGSGQILPEDRWMFEVVHRGASILPRLRWSKRLSGAIRDQAHVTVAFDVFDSKVETIEQTVGSAPRSLEVYGLFPPIVRGYSSSPEPTWTTTVSDRIEGDKHPVARGLSERLLRSHTTVLKSVKRAGDSSSSFPVLISRVDAERADQIQRMHELSDWVVTVDRNAGLEFYDSPLELPQIYDIYVIDCVPERSDLDVMQLITSTNRVDEALLLLDEALSEMSLSASPRNCQFLLKNLKAISGRLAMRLASQGYSRSELIALSLLYSNLESDRDTHCWLPLTKGFLVPVDDIRDLLRLSDNGSDEPDDVQDSTSSRARADLMYVAPTKKGGLEFTFIEVKYRRLSKSAREASLLSQVVDQLTATQKALEGGYFNAKLATTEQVMNRRRLAKALRFYADKALRHHLQKDVHAGVMSAIDRLVRSTFDINAYEFKKRGYIFCPEATGAVSILSETDGCRIILFGPRNLPDSPPTIESAVDNHFTAPILDHDNGENPKDAVPADAAIVNTSTTNDAANVVAEIHIGKTLSGDDACWTTAIKGNPHLMIVGIPGMGKTTCIENICFGLHAQAITPIVFDYHGDLERSMIGAHVEAGMVDFVNGLGFNPMQIIGTTPHAWIDNVGMLRDIFASIYPDFGDIQLNEIREAIKQSYIECGFGGEKDTPVTTPVPPFVRFWEILSNKERLNTGVRARLGELSDYAFFRDSGNVPSLLLQERPCVVRLSSVQNDVIQNALASFVLLNTYQSMFLRGPQQRLTHAIVFDEAHRAARLRLLPSMARECRKYGIALIVASQSARDFSPALFSAIGSYLVLRVAESDAISLSKAVAHGEDVQRMATRLKQLEKFSAYLFCEGRKPSAIQLTAPSH